MIIRLDMGRGIDTSALQGLHGAGFIHASRLAVKVHLLDNAGQTLVNGVAIAAGRAPSFL